MPPEDSSHGVIGLGSFERVSMLRVPASPGINHLRIQKIAMLNVRHFKTFRRFFALRFSGCERTLRCCETGF